MIDYSVPSDFEIRTLKDISKLNQLNPEHKITEIYGQVTDGYIKSSGRMVSMLKTVSINSFGDYLAECRKRGIQFNYTINASCMSNMEKEENTISFIRELIDAGVDSFTVSIPRLIEIIRKKFPDIEIKASAICAINTVNKARAMFKLGVNRIVLDPNITRCFNVIKQITDEFPEKCEIILNNMCVKNCIFTLFHYNYDAHCTLDCTNEDRYYLNKCSYQKAMDFANYLRLNWIRPEDLHYYIGCGLKRFKLQGRNVHDGKLILKAIKHYINQDFDGNLIELLTVFTPYNIVQPYINNKKLDGFIKKFYLNPAFCNDDCKKCGYCESFLEKCANVNELEELKSMAQVLYT